MKSLPEILEPFLKKTHKDHLLLFLNFNKFVTLSKLLLEWPLINSKAPFPMCKNPNLLILKTLA